MTSRLNIIQRERRCSRCEEIGHTVRNCNFTTIDEYCRFRNNTEYVPMFFRRQNSLLTVSPETIQEARSLIHSQNASQNTEKKEICLLYYHFEQENDDTNMECGMCLTDNMKTCRMAKLNCGHTFCDRCTDKLITEEKSCCAFCRAEITSVEVSSGESYGMLKDNTELFRNC